MRPIIIQVPSAVDIIIATLYYYSTYCSSIGLKLRMFDKILENQTLRVDNQKKLDSL